MRQCSVNRRILYVRACEVAEGDLLLEEGYTLLELLIIVGEVIPMLTRGTCGGVVWSCTRPLVCWLKDFCTDGDVRLKELARAVGSGCSRAVTSDH